MRLRFCRYASAAVLLIYAPVAIGYCQALRVNNHGFAIRYGAPFEGY